MAILSVKCFENGVGEAKAQLTKVKANHMMAWEGRKACALSLVREPTHLLPDISRVFVHGSVAVGKTVGLLFRLGIPLRQVEVRKSYGWAFVKFGKTLSNLGLRIVQVFANTIGFAGGLLTNPKIGVWVSKKTSQLDRLRFPFVPYIVSVFLKFKGKKIPNKKESEEQMKRLSGVLAKIAELQQQAPMEVDPIGDTIIGDTLPDFFGAIKRELVRLSAIDQNISPEEAGGEYITLREKFTLRARSNPEEFTMLTPSWQESYKKILAVLNIKVNKWGIEEELASCILDGGDLSDKQGAVARLGELISKLDRIRQLYPCLVPTASGKFENHEAGRDLFQQLAVTMAYYDRLTGYSIKYIKILKELHRERQAVRVLEYYRTQVFPKAEQVLVESLKFMLGASDQLKQSQIPIQMPSQPVSVQAGLMALQPNPNTIMSELFGNLLWNTVCVGEFKKTSRIRNELKQTLNKIKENQSK